MENLNKIREIRRSQGYTLETLSQQMGVSPSALEKVEKGQRRLKQYFVARASEVLRVDPHELANGQDIDQEARIATTYRKPGEDSPNILQNRSIRLYKSSGLSIPKDQTPHFIACPSTVWADPDAFALSIAVVPDEIEQACPWISAGSICFCTATASFKKGALVAIDLSGGYILGHIESFKKNREISISPWGGEGDLITAHESEVYPVVTINIS